jgi:hypothetical protein
MSIENEGFDDLKKEILKYIGFILKSSDCKKLNNDTFAGEKNFFMYRYSLATFRVVENKNLAYSTMANEPVPLSHKKKEPFTIDGIFVSLKNKYADTGFVRMSNKVTEIHIYVIKQYWFDCCVSFQGFFNMLMAPMQGKTWVNCEDFLRSIEAVHQRNICRIFLPPKEEKKISMNLKIQKFLCKGYLVFFCVVQNEYVEMNIESLIKVAELSNRMCKAKQHDALTIANTFLTRANNRRKEVRSYITLKEFIALLLSSSF